MLPDFYISSSEGHMEGDARSCFILKQINCGGRDDCLLIRLSHPLRGEHYGMDPSEIHQVILVTRLTGNSIIAPIRWPIPVYVLHSNITNLEEREIINSEEYKIIAWAEIYKEKDQAPPSVDYTFG